MLRQKSFEVNQVVVWSLIIINQDKLTKLEGAKSTIWYFNKCTLHEQFILDYIKAYLA